MNSNIHKALSELRHRLKTLYGKRLVKMILYGSQARGDAKPDSDIDVLVVLKGRVSPCEEIERTERDVAEVSLDYDVVAICVFVSEEQFEHERSPLLLNVRREGVLL